MKAQVITIGDEILIGQVVDTNSAWICARLNELGVAVEQKITVPDDPQVIRHTIDRALGAYDVVITTGGIGPTRDDRTKQVVAELFGCPLVRHQPTYEHIERMLARRGIAFNELNRSQAMVPACADILPNANGTAPGMWFERDGHVLAVMPGVPFEMEALMTGEVLPRLQARTGAKGIVHRTMITSGIAESLLAEKIAPWEDALPSYLKLAYLPSPSGVRLRLSAYDVDTRTVGPRIDAQFAALEKIITPYVVGYGTESPESYLARRLTQRGLTLSVAESCTGGALASRFTAMAGASRYFLGGAVAYSNHLKTALLGVTPDDIARHGAVSRTVAEQMAAGVRRAAGSDYALSVTGIAGPDGGSDEKPVGTVWIGLAWPQGVEAQLFHFGNLRRQNIDRAITAAVNMLRDKLSADGN